MSDFSIGTVRSARRSSLPSSARGVFRHVLSFLREMMRARASRRLLSEMDDRLLADIGLGRGDALHEARRPMWDLAQRRT